MPGGHDRAVPTRAGLEPSAARPRTFVSLTTIPPRLGNIETCVNSLLEQTAAPEKIFICIPRNYRRFGVPDPLPSELSRFGERVEIVRPSEDFGPGTKLLGAFDRIPRDPNVQLVLVDDDMIYRPYMLAAFGEHFSANPGSAASFYTYRYKGLPLGQGADGFALPASLLGGVREFYREAVKCPEAFFVDDLWISYFLWLKRIPIVGLEPRPGDQYIFQHIYNDAQALNRETGASARRRVMRRTYWHLGRRFGWREIARRGLGLPARRWSGGEGGGRT